MKKIKCFNKYIFINYNRLTTSNKNKLYLGNFDSESKSLLHNLSRMILDKNDFKGSISFIEKLKGLFR